MTDSEFKSIVADAIGGDDGALAALYDHYHRMLVRYLRPQAPELGEQLARQAWLAVAAQLDTFAFAGDERAFRRLLLSQADLLVRGRYRSARSDGTSPPTPPVIDLRHSPVGDEPVADAAIADLLLGLSPHQAHVLLLRVVGGLTADETAELLHETASTIRLTEHEALQQIAQRLRGEQSMARP